MSAWKERCSECLEAAVSSSESYTRILFGEDTSGAVSSALILKWQQISRQLLEAVDDNLDKDEAEAIEEMLSEMILIPLNIMWESTTERLAQLNGVNVKDALDVIKVEYLERGVKRDPIECARYIIECINNQFTTLKHLTGYEYPKIETI